MKSAVGRRGGVHGTKTCTKSETSFGGSSVASVRLEEEEE